MKQAKHFLLQVNRKLFYLLLFLSVLFWQCQKEEIDFSTNTSSVPTIKKISFSEFKKNTKASRKFDNSKTFLKQNLHSKLVVDSINNFYYNTNDINIIEYQDYHSYIIPVYRKSENNFLENLFIHLKNDGEYAAFLIQYDLTESEIADLKNNVPIPNLIEKTSYTLLENYDINTLENTDSRTSGCGNHGYSGYWTVNGVCCYVIDRVISSTMATVIYCGTPQQLGVTVPNIAPPESSGGGGSGNNNDWPINFSIISSVGNPNGEPITNPFGTVGGGSGSSQEVIIINTPVLIDPNIVDLNKITTREPNKPNPFRDKIDEYVANINTYQVETGVEF